VTLPSVMVPSTSISRTLIWLARFFTEAEILGGRDGKLSPQISISKEFNMKRIAQRQLPASSVAV
jgi:hypothetical protein